MSEPLDFVAIRSDRAALVKALEAAGAVFKGNSCTCPFHDDRTASAGIHEAEGQWRFRCHACGEHGDLIDIRAKSNGSDRTTECKRLKSGKSGNAPIALAGKPGPARPIYATLEALEAATERASQGGRLSETYVYTDNQNATCLIVMRLERPDGSKTFRQASPAGNGYVMQAPAGPLPLFNLARVKAAETVLVVEGEKAAMALERAGYVATTSAMGAGKASKTDWSPLQGKTVYLWPDNDPADVVTGKSTGIEHMRQVREILEALPSPPALAWIVPGRLGLPPKGDAFDFVHEHGRTAPEMLAEVLTQAQPLGVLADLQADLQAAVSGKRFAVPMPWSMLSRGTRALLPGTVTILCGSPGATKSLCLLQALVYWMRAGHKAAVLELEDGRAYHMRRMLAQLAHNAELTDDDWCRQHPIETAQAQTTYQSEMLALQGCLDALPAEVSPTPEAFLNWLQRKADSGCRVLCIDPVTLMIKGGKPWEADEKFVFGAKRIVERAGASLVLVSHPRRLPHGGKDANATMDDLAGGTAYARFTQTILFLRAHDIKHGEVETTAGRCRDSWNRTLTVFKARNGRGVEGVKFAYEFSGPMLSMREIGRVVKQEAECTTKG